MKRRIRGLPPEKHPAWKGDAAGLSAIHDWVRKLRPYTGFCQICRAEGYTENANLSGEYRRDLDDFMEMCKSCHAVYDGREANFASVR